MRMSIITLALKMIKFNKNIINEIKVGSYIIFKPDYNSNIERVYILTYICKDYLDRKVIYSNDDQIYETRIYYSADGTFNYYLLNEKEVDYYLKLATFK